MPVFFPPGEGKSSAHWMTELVEEVRQVLRTIGEHRQRPYTLAVHVLDSPGLSFELGLDVATWLEKKLVDVLVVGLGYRPYCVAFQRD